MRHRRRRVNFVYWDSGAGMTHDISILESIFRSSGLRVRHVVTKDRSCRVERVLKLVRQWQTVLMPSFAQIHFEQIHREQWVHGRYNFILPNPEFTDNSVFNKLLRPPILLCKTRHANQLFQNLLRHSLYIGFTSRDRQLATVGKDFRRFLHVAGLSDFKGTHRLAALWARNPHWPRLTIIRSAIDRNCRQRPGLPSAPNIELIAEWIEDDHLRELQNQCGVHLCPSETEGFGHYIMEGLSTGSVVVTTDASPMHEFIGRNSGYLVRADPGKKLFMSKSWLFDESALANKIESILSLPEEHLRQVGAAARRRFICMDADFRGRMKILLHQYFRQPVRYVDKRTVSDFTRTFAHLLLPASGRK